ncbi:hypothetical protein [Herbiconiux liukaitaii]|uniref:hypothetical protein n=1 Tax=Herbiconiux liukaitaii TaxID=3342799 RepID=UPI0035BAD1C9
MANGDVPFQNAAVYVWHCDAVGGYSMYSDGIENETYVRGAQVADADGTISYTSTFPACHTVRWPHIHFEVHPSVDDIGDSAIAIAIPRVALPEEVNETVYALSDYAGSTENVTHVSLDSDIVFGDEGGALQLATMSGDVESCYAVSLTARVDTGTSPAAGAAPTAAAGRGHSSRARRRNSTRRGWHASGGRLGWNTPGLMNG